MMDKKQIRRAAYAKMITEDPLWEEIWDEIKMDLFNQFIEHTDMQTRERIAMATDMLDEFKIKLATFIAEGTSLKLVGDDNGN